MKTYSVKKQKLDKNEKKHYQEVGTLIIRDGEKNGVLFLNHLDGEFAVSEREPKVVEAEEEAA